MFPREGDGYCVDVEVGNQKLRLFAAIQSKHGGWVSSVYDLQARRWIVEAEYVGDPEQSKQRAIELASTFMQAALPNELSWNECPAGWSNRQQ